ncbi:hypothetical protein JTE90_004862 [Oedothorax gibbosus]|uniref:Uncharacterized protein n=1 Tax=Oedothorax gibbosus TaxID=931172 RepID=A0AAV6US05_9ARAC|nr:hypothetical protein JTE90_004862 [Oedothorax gibbosus]
MTGTKRTNSSFQSQPSIQHLNDRLRSFLQKEREREREREEKVTRREQQQKIPSTRLPIFIFLRIEKDLSTPILI